MLDQALSHLPGIGPERLRRLHDAGIWTWADVCARPPPPTVRLGPAAWDAVRCEAERCQQACQNGDLRYLATRLNPADRWRLLAEYLADATFVDIETTGLTWSSQITVIAGWQNGRCHTFVRGENLDAALDLLEQARLLVSFNGSSFDVPHILRAFNIPELPCSHLDLRWVCYREALRGGLKAIERALGFNRPPELVGVDGAEAVQLWQAWERHHDAAARQRLESYCRADTLAMRRIAVELLRRRGCAIPPETTDDGSAGATPSHAQNPPGGEPVREYGRDTVPSPSADSAIPRSQPDFARLRRLLFEQRGNADR